MDNSTDIITGPLKTGRYLAIENSAKNFSNFEFRHFLEQVLKIELISDISVSRDEKGTELGCIFVEYKEEIQFNELKKLNGLLFKGEPCFPHLFKTKAEFIKYISSFVYEKKLSNISYLPNYLSYVYIRGFNGDIDELKKIVNEFEGFINIEKKTANISYFIVTFNQTESAKLASAALNINKKDENIESRFVITIASQRVIAVPGNFEPESIYKAVVALVNISEAKIDSNGTIYMLLQSMDHSRLVYAFLNGTTINSKKLKIHFVIFDIYENLKVDAINPRTLGY